jgi:isocitrate dehydrogenase kinase/phosphatase
MVKIKNLRRVFLVVVMMLGTFLSASANSNDISQAFAKGDVAKIYSYMNSSLELSIQNNSSSCDKNRAKNLLEDFFRKNRPSNYSLMSKNEKGKSAVLLGKLYTNGGEYTLMILTQKENDKNLICQIKITSK